MRILRSNLARLGLAAVAGALSVTAFAPFEWWWIIFPCFAALAGLIYQQKPRLAFAVGFAWGLGLYLTGVSWVYVSLNVYGGMPLWMGAIAVLGFCALLAVFAGLPCWVTAKIM